MEPERHYLSQEKYDELVAELDNLKTVRRREVADRLEFAKSLGDLSENAEYHSARDEQADLEERIGHLETVLKQTEIISNTHKGSTVRIGSTVAVTKDGGDESTLTIVGPEETDPLAGKISYQSPLGAGLLGKKAGETSKITTPKGKVEYKVISIK